MVYVFLAVAIVIGFVFPFFTCRALLKKKDRPYRGLIWLGMVINWCLLAYSAYVGVLYDSLTRGEEALVAVVILGCVLVDYLTIKKSIQIDDD